MQTSLYCPSGPGRTAREPAHTHSDYTQFPLPTPYTPRVRSALNASPSAVRLSSLVGQSGWWYRWGCRIADALEDRQSAQLLGMLRRAFLGRLPPLQDLAAHHAGADRSLAEGGAGAGETFKEGMEADERERERILAGFGAKEDGG